MGKELLTFFNGGLTTRREPFAIFLPFREGAAVEPDPKMTMTHKEKTMLSYIATYLKAAYRLMHDDQSGQALVEYILIIILISLAVIMASPTITSALVGAFSKIASALSAS